MRKCLYALVPALCLLAGCRTNGYAREPFDIRFVNTAQWTVGGKGYDPRLPGYRLTGDICAITLRLRSTVETPDKLVLAIRTSPGMEPMLERFELITPDKIIQSALRDGTGLTLVKDRKSGVETTVKRGAYFVFSVVGKEVRVTLQPRAIQLLRDQCAIKWIDWFRK